MPTDVDVDATTVIGRRGSTSAASPRSSRVQRSVTAPGDMRLYEGTMRPHDLSIDGDERKPTPYSSWSSPSRQDMSADPRHSGRVYTFMPSAARVPVPPPVRPQGSLTAIPGSPPMSPPRLRRGAPYSPAMSDASQETFSPLEAYLPAGCGPPDPTGPRRSSLASLPPSSPPLPTTVSCAGETYFEHASDAGSGSYFSLSPRSWHRGSDGASSAASGPADPAGTTTLTSPPPSEIGCGVLEEAIDEATYWPERRPLDPAALHHHASIGRSVDDALSALLGATSLVKAGLGSAALVIGPVDGQQQHRTIGPTGRRHSVGMGVPEASRRTPSPPSEMGGSGAASGPDQRLITVRPASMTTMSAQPRAIRAIVTPATRVVRPPA